MSNQVKKDMVVGFSYTLKDEKGNVMEQTEAGQPMEYLHGNHNIIPGLENELEGMKVGESKSVTVAPGDAYGEFDENLLFKVPRENFPQDIEIKPGMEFQTETEDGLMVITVKEVNDKEVVVDGNHPMAGSTLHFDVKIENVREATEQEKTHGHVHAHGHDH